MTSIKVLVTGITGFIGSEVAIAFLNKGYSVRGTARSDSKAQAWAKLHPEFGTRLEFAIVPDIGVEGAFDEAAKDIDWIIHTASPVFGSTSVATNDSAQLRPTIQGTLEALKAAMLHLRVKRVIITSCASLGQPRLSTAMRQLTMGEAPYRSTTTALFTPQYFCNGVLDETVWMSVGYDEASKADNPAFVYAAAKTLAEKSAWQFMADKKPRFTLTTLQPPWVYGPSSAVAQKGPLTGTNSNIGRLFNPELDANTLWPKAGGPMMTDVRDVALGHVLAVELEAAAGQRFFLTGHRSFPVDYLRILHERLPERASELVKLPKDYQTPTAYFTSNKKSIEILGMTYRSVEETVVDTANYAIAMRA